MRQCKAKRKNGAPCAAQAGADGYCAFHSPTHGKARAVGRKLGGKHRRRVENTTPFPDADVKSAVGLAAFVESVMRDTWKLESGVSRSRTLGYLAQVQKGILEIGELEERLAALEAALKTREGAE
jgi:hypothetical protein